MDLTTNPASFTLPIAQSDVTGLADALAAKQDALPVTDSTALVKGSGDATKLVRFEADGLTTGTTRVLTVPDADLTIAGIATTQTLTNKTIALGSNTVSGTKAQFDTAVTDDNFAYLGQGQTFVGNQVITGTLAVSSSLSAASGTFTGSGAQLLLSVAGNPAEWLRNTNVTHPFTAVGFDPEITANVVGSLVGAQSANGGCQLNGFNTSSATASAVNLIGHLGSASPSVAAISIAGWKTNGTTGRTALTGSEKILAIQAGSSEVVSVTAAGSLSAASGTFTGDVTVGDDLTVTDEFLAGRIESTGVGVIAGVLAVASPVGVGPYTVATVPSAATHAGRFIRITDRAQKHAYSDGTNWRFFGDDVVIS